MNRWILLYCSLVGNEHECMTALCCCISIWTTATCIMVVCCCVCLSLTFRVVMLVSRTVLKLQIHNIYPISPINDETLRISSSFLFIISNKISGRSFHLVNKPAASTGVITKEEASTTASGPSKSPPPYSAILWWVLEVLEKGSGLPSRSSWTVFGEQTLIYSEV